MLGIKLRDTVLVRRLADDVLELPPMVIDGFEIEETKEVKFARALLMEALKVDNEWELNKAINGRIDKDDISEEEAEQILSDAPDENESSSSNLSQIAEILADDSIPIEEKQELAKRLRDLHDIKESTITRGSQGIRFGDIQNARVAMGIAKAKQFKFIYNTVIDQIGPHIKNGKLVIFYIFKSTGDIIQRELLKLGYTEDQIIRVDGETKIVNGYRGYLVKKFQKNPNIKIFLGTIETCATAITLTAANTSILFELDWRPGIVAQAMKRTHRYAKDQAETKAVYEIFPYAKLSIDANVFDRLRVKKAIQRQVLDSFPNEHQIDKYETQFKDKEIPGARYPLEQRILIAKAAFQIQKAIDESQNIDYDKLGLSYADVYKLRDFNSEVASTSWKYNGVKAIKTAEFPENLIDDILPIIWKKRTLIRERPLWLPGGIDFPESITGTRRGLFSPISTGGYAVRDTASGPANPMHMYLYAATRPVRLEMLENIRKRKALARAGKQESEIDELSRLAEEAE